MHLHTKLWNLGSHLLDRLGESGKCFVAQAHHLLKQGCKIKDKQESHLWDVTGKIKYFAFWMKNYAGKKKLSLKHMTEREPARRHLSACKCAVAEQGEASDCCCTQSQQAQYSCLQAPAQVQSSPLKYWALIGKQWKLCLPRSAELL